MNQRATALYIPLALSLVIGCGGEDAPAPPAAQPAAAAAGAGGARPAGSAAAQAPADTAPLNTDSTQLQREVFAYRGAGRDPFLSLMKTANIRPLVTDLRLMGVTYDAAYPARSVAVLRDTAQRKRYAVRAGDELGLMKVTEIRDNAVVVTLDEFGVERQVVLPMRRRPEETP